MLIKDGERKGIVSGFHSKYPVSQWQIKRQKHIGVHPLPRSEKVVKNTFAVTSFPPFFLLFALFPSTVLFVFCSRSHTNLLSTKVKDQGF